MSTESTIDQDSLDSVFTKAESVENIDNAENMMMSITGKLAANFRILKGLLERQVVPSFTHESQKKAIKRLEEHLEQHFNEITNSKDSKLDDVVILAESFIHMCNIRLSEVFATELEELYVAEFFLMRSIILLKSKELNNKTVLTSMRTYNELSFLYIRLKDLKKSSLCLNKALEIYFAYTEGQDEFPAPVNIETTIGVQVESNTVYLLDSMYMTSLSTLIKLSNHYGYESIDMEKIATYMHKILKKLLIICKPLSINYIEWALEAIQLAEYFLSCHRLIECKNHLCAASFMMTRCYNEVYLTIDEETSVREKDIVHGRFKTVVSIIDMIWVKYGLIILYLSKKRLEGKEEETNESKTEPTTQFNKKFSELLLFTGADEEFKRFISMLPDDYITNYDNAKTLFIRILKFLNNLKAGSFSLVSAEFRADIAHYTSKAYKYLAFYEHDTIKQIKLQKRRIDILEDCLKTLHAKDNLDSCTFLWFELGVIYSTLLDMKMENLEISKLTTEDLVEINLLVKNSARYFQLHSDTSKQIDAQADRNYQIMSHFNLRYKKTQIYVNLSDKYNI